jgi:hypothetical protein
VKWTHVVHTVWNGIVNWVRQESAAATALVQAFIALGIAFSWWTWSPAQTGAVIGITAAMLGMFVRSQVTPIVRSKGLAPAGRSQVQSPAQGPAQGQVQNPAPDGPRGWPDRPTDPPSGPGTRPL